MQPVISMRQAFCEHLLLPCGVCNNSGSVTACHNWRKSFVAIVFRIIGVLCSIAWLLLAHDRGPCSLFFCRWFWSHSRKICTCVLCSSAMFSLFCSIASFTAVCSIAVFIALCSVFCSVAASALCSITVCVGVAVCRLWHKECIHACRLCALCAATGEQESVCSGAVVEQSLALVHHCDAFAREGLRCRFCFNATVACGQKYAELARREPHCTIRTEDESAYSLPCTLDESALRCFRCTFCVSDAAHTSDERLDDRSKRLLCLGEILRHVEVRNVGCSHRCCKCCHD